MPANDNLLDAISEGDMTKLESAIKDGADLNKAIYWNIPLILATELKRYDTIKYIVEHGGNVNIKDPERDLITPLWLAVEKASVEIVKYLLEHGAKPNDTDNEGTSPLMNAARNGNLDIIKLLIEHHANVNQECKLVKNPNLENMHGWRAIQSAVLADDPIPVLKLLIDHGAEVNYMTKAEFSYPPIRVAIECDKQDVIDWLLEHAGARMEINGISCMTVSYDKHCKRHLNMQLLSRVDVNMKMKNGETLLTEAIKNEHLDIIHELLNYGANPNVKNKSNETPLLLVVKNSELVKLLLDHGVESNDPMALQQLVKDNNIEILKLLLDHGADPNSPSLLRDAVKGNYFDIVKLLLERGANPNNSSNLLRIASDDIKMTKLLLEHGADPNERNDNGETPLFAVSQPEIAKLLFDYGADPHVKDNYGYCANPVPHIYCDICENPGSPELIQVFIDHGWDINSDIIYKRTPIQDAIETGNVEMIKFLLEHGADINHPNKNGELPLVAAFHTGQASAIFGDDRRYRETLKWILDNYKLVPK